MKRTKGRKIFNAVTPGSSKRIPPSVIRQHFFPAPPAPAPVPAPALAPAPAKAEQASKGWLSRLTGTEGYRHFYEFINFVFKKADNTGDSKVRRGPAARAGRSRPPPCSCPPRPLTLSPILTMPCTPTHITPSPPPTSPLALSPPPRRRRCRETSCCVSSGRNAKRALAFAAGSRAMPSPSPPAAATSGPSSRHAPHLFPPSPAIFGPHTQQHTHQLQFTAVVALCPAPLSPAPHLPRGRTLRPQAQRRHVREVRPRRRRSVARRSMPRLSRTGSHQWDSAALISGIQHEHVPAPSHAPTAPYAQAKWAIPSSSSP